MHLHVCSCMEQQLVAECKRLNKNQLRVHKLLNITCIKHDKKHMFLTIATTGSVYSTGRYNMEEGGLLIPFQKYLSVPRSRYCNRTVTLIKQSQY